VQTGVHDAQREFASWCVGWAKERKRRAHHQSLSKLQNGGHASLWPPYEAARRELICFAPKRNFMQWPATNWRDGKSLLIFRNRVNPGNQKYSAFVPAQIIGITPLVSPD
jgi:hypothetical protein